MDDSKENVCARLDKGFIAKVDEIATSEYRQRANLIKLLLAKAVEIYENEGSLDYLLDYKPKAKSER